MIVDNWIFSDFEGQMNHRKLMPWENQSLKICSVKEDKRIDVAYIWEKQINYIPRFVDTCWASMKKSYERQNK